MLRIALHTETEFSLLRSKIRELHPVHRASLEALLRHLLRVASHLDKNEMTVEALATEFRYGVLRGSKVKDGVNSKARCINALWSFIADSLRNWLWRISYKMRIPSLMNTPLHPSPFPHSMRQRQRLRTLMARCF